MGEKVASLVSPDRELQVSTVVNTHGWGENNSDGLLAELHIHTQRYFNASC